MLLVNVKDVKLGKAERKSFGKIEDVINMQNLIDSWRKRLCFQASPETRSYAEDFKVVLHEVFPELADVLQCNCLYRCGCPEMSGCGYFKKWVKESGISMDEAMDIQTRYDVFNSLFYANHPFLGKA